MASERNGQFTITLVSNLRQELRAWELMAEYDSREILNCADSIARLNGSLLKFGGVPLLKNNNEKKYPTSLLR